MHLLTFYILVIFNQIFTTAVQSYYNRPDENEDLFQGDINLTQSSFRSAVRSRWSRWYDGQVRFGFLEENGKTISSEDRDVIRQAIKELTSMINSVSADCLTFTEMTADDYKDSLPALLFYSGDGCHSNVGMSGGKQLLSLGRGCIHEGYIWHELLHCLGLWHEHTRPDRDQYVTINWQNIEAGARVNFEIQPLSKIDDLDTPYDYSSLMHYPVNYFSVDGIRPTITVKTPFVKIGQRNQPSSWDIRRIRILYECEPRPSV